MTPDLTPKLIELALARPEYAATLLYDFEYQTPDHLLEIYTRVYDAFQNPSAPKRLLRLLPRDHGKSEACANVIPVWAALRDPNIQILLMSETSRQAKNKLRQCREALEKWAPEYAHEIASATKKELTLERTENLDLPTISARGYNQPIAGAHYDLSIFDDVADWPNQRTNSQREAIWTQFQNYTNIDSGGETVFLVIGTRKHPDDLYQKLIDSPAWDHKVRQAISDYSIIEQDEYDIVTDKENIYPSSQLAEITDETVVDVKPHREVDVLWEDRWPLNKILSKRLMSLTEGGSALVWKRENQNDASALMGQTLKEEWLTYVDEVPKDRNLRYFAGLDLAFTDDPEAAAKSDTDYWAIAVVAYDAETDTNYLLQVERTRGVSFHGGFAWAMKIVNQHDPRTQIVIEANQAESAIRQEAKKLDLNFSLTKSNTGKEKRIQGLSGAFETGDIKLVDADEPSAWQNFVAEWVEFPSGDHDDQLDAIEIAMRWHNMREDVHQHDLSDLPLSGPNTDDIAQSYGTWSARHRGNFFGRR